MITSFFITAGLIGVVVSVFTYFYITFAFKIPRGRKRDMLTLVHPIITVGFVLLSSFILNRFFYGLKGEIDFTYFYLIWILPYGITVIWLFYKNKKSKH